MSGVHLSFDELKTNEIVSTQFPPVTFSSTQGNVHYITTQTDYNGSKPNFICTGPLGGAFDCRQDSIIDFSTPVNNLTFSGMGINAVGQVALIDVYQDNALVATQAVIGHAAGYEPEHQDLSSFHDVTRIHIRNITDGGGIGWDDFRFDATPAPMTLAAIPSVREVGDHVSLLATLRNPETGDPRPDVLVKFGVISGPHKDFFAALNRTDATGTAFALLRGRAPGTDVVQAWLDLNINGRRDAGEDYATATVIWNEPEAGTVEYVAFGDSITTGESIATCNEDLDKSKWKCQSTPAGSAPRASPYPTLVAEHLDLELDRVGIWGYTAARAAEVYPGSDEGRWPSQLSEINRASVLVTGALGINDMRFSDYKGWVWQFRTRQAKGRASDLVRDIAGPLDELFSVLKAAKARGATVVVTLYYNPYDNQVGCGTTYGIADLITATLNAELSRRASEAGLLIADFKSAFAGHGANSRDPYVWGSQCDLSGAIGSAFPDWDQTEADGAQGVKERFDPHPNAKGTAAMARVIEGVLKW